MAEIKEHGIEVIRLSSEEVAVGNTRELLIRVRVKNTDLDPVNVSGEFAFSGLSEAIKVTTQDIGDTESALPVTSLTNRNSMSIRNLSLSEVLYIGPTGVTADASVGTTSGWEIPPGEDFNVDIAGDITIYAIAPSGKTIRVKVMEMA